MSRIKLDDEPVFGGKKDPSIGVALNWYNYNKTSEDSKKYCIQILKEKKHEGWNKLTNVPIAEFQNIGFILRMQERGAKLNLEQISSINNSIDNLIALGAKIKEPIVVKEDDTPKVSIQERTADKTGLIIGDMEGLCDDFITKGAIDIKPYGWMITQGVKGVHSKIIISHFNKKIDEYTEILNTKDKDLKEGYSNFTKEDIRKYIKFLKSIVDDCNTIINDVKVMRKKKAKIAAKKTTRTRKPVAKRTRKTV